MTPDLEIWDKVADSWDKKVATDGTMRTVLFEDCLLPLFENLQGKKVLDAGCGNGYITDMLSEEGADVIGIDGSANMVAAAKDRYPNLNFHQADLLKPLEFDTSTFDVVLANMVLMHLSEIGTFLQEAERVLKPEGTMISSILHPCFNEPATRLRRGLLSKITGRKVVGVALDYYDKQKCKRFESQVNEELTHYHRTIEEYSAEFLSKGFVITDIKEPHDLPEEFLSEHPELEYALRLPRFMIFKTIKRKLL